MEWPIEKQTLAGLGLASLVLVGLNVLSYWSFTKHRETDAWVAHTHKVLQKIESSLSLIKDAETGQRGYLIAGQEGYLKPYETAASSIYQQITELRKLTVDNPNQQRRIDTFESLVSQKLAILKQTIGLRKAKGYKAAKQIVQTGRGQEMMERIRQVGRAMEAEENQLLKHRLEREHGSAYTQSLISSSGIILAFLLFYLVYYAIKREINERRRVQVALQHANQELEATISELKCANEQLQATQDELRKSLEKETELNKLKSRLITTISHEYRTPLTTILFSAELLEHYGYKFSEEKKLTHLQRIQANTKHLTDLVSDVLFIGQAEANKLKFSPALVDLEQWCRELVEEMQFNASTQQIIIKFSIRGNGKKTYMDEKMLRQIFTNLLSNAVKYSPQGSTVWFELDCSDDIAQFVVKDKGIGIPAADLSQLFEAFHRAGNVGTLPGTGLGLAIVKKCVDLHGGQISVESFAGEGTTFTVRLPLPSQTTFIQDGSGISSIS